MMQALTRLKSIFGRPRHRTTHQGFRPQLGMTTYEEQEYCYNFARHYSPGMGVLVDLGCWLGAPSIALAQGLQDNRRRHRPQKLVHAYDLFRWQQPMDQYVKSAPLKGQYRPGDSFLNETISNVTPWKKWLWLHVGNIATRRWIGEPIAFLFVDVMKDLDLTKAILRQFFPSLVMDSIIVQRDFTRHDSGWAHLIHYHWRNAFTVSNDLPNSPSVVFQLDREILREELEDLTWLESPTAGLVTVAFEHSRALVDPIKHGGLFAAEIVTKYCLGHHHLAYDLFDEVRETEHFQHPEMTLVAKRLAQLRRD